MALFDKTRNHIGIDLGTSTVQIYIPDKGIVLNEPSVVAVNKVTGKILAVGEAARIMIGKTPGNIVAVRPLQEGIISNFHDTERMLRYFLNKVIPKKLFIKPHVVICVPSGITDVEKRAVLKATVEAGAGNTSLIEEPLAAAIGAGIDIGLAQGNMIIDIGGGTTDIAVISLGESVVSHSIKVAGNVFDECIVRYVKKKYNLLIGERTAETVKINIGTAFPKEDEAYIEVTGRSMVLGLPKTITLCSSETTEAFQEPLTQMIEAVHNIMEKIPPELLSDIFNNGICMTGGGALLFGLDRLLTEFTKIPCYVAEDAILCVAIGTGKVLESTNVYSHRAVYQYTSERSKK